MATLFVDRLTNIDFAYLDTERGLVGETWLMDVELGGDLDAQGMVFDFGHVKRCIKALVDARYDHALLVPLAAAGLEYAETDGQVTLRLPLPDGHLHLRSPAEAVAGIHVPAISAQAVAGVLEVEIARDMPANVDTVRVRLMPEAIDGAYYHYCHGLKLHDGNCQRIAHGHRSQVHILRGGTRDAALEADWAARWADRFLGTAADEVAAAAGHRRFAYDAPQGRFELELPAGRVEVIDTETTVENLAAYMADTLFQRCGESIRVRAFEGAGKGAIAER